MQDHRAFVLRRVPLSDTDYESCRVINPPVLLEPVLTSLRYACKSSTMATQMNVRWAKRPTDEDHLRIGRIAYSDPHLRLLIIHPPEVAFSVWTDGNPPASVLAAINRVSSFSSSSCNFIFDCSASKGGLGGV